MYAIEFNTTSKDGVIYIPQEYKDELGDREDIRLVVMYDLPLHKKNYTNKKELETLEKLFLNSDNQVIVTKDISIDTDELIDDIS